jgi:hypothetical protein
MCPKEEFLSAYLDNEIASPWRERIGSHLKGCEHCRQRLEALKSVSALLHSGESSAVEQEALRVKRRIEFTLEHRTQPYSGRDYDSAVTHLPFFRKHVLVPMPVFAGGFLAILVLVASLFFFMGKNGSELIQAKADLEKMKTIHVYYPVQNPDQLLKILQEKNQSEEVIFQLPETDTFQVIGEPEIIRVNDVKR